MTKKILILSVLALTICSFAYFGENSNTPKKSDRSTTAYNVVDPSVNENGRTKQILQYANIPIIFEGSKNFGDYIIGPEIPTGLSGFYDYHFNGEQNHYLFRHSPTEMHAVYMLTLDSTDPQGPTRRTKYAFSDDDGATWLDLGEVPNNYRSGYPSVNAKNDGSAVVANHMIPTTGGDLTTYEHYDLLPGGGTFTSVRSPETINFAWPIISRLTNGFIMNVGSSYRGTVGTDTPTVVIFNTTTNTFGTAMARLSGSTSDNNASIASATGPGGKAIIIINAYRETGGNWGEPRIFMTQSNDNGQTWSNPVVVFNPHVIGSDSVVAYQNGATDVIFDDAGNYYFAFNSLGKSDVYADARLWFSKNGGEPVIIAGSGNSPVNPIPESVISMQGQNFISSFDHPCLSISADQQYIFCSYSVSHEADTLNGWTKSHIYYSFSELSNISWKRPLRVTNSGPNSYDEKFASLATRTPVASGEYTLYMTYQKDSQPGSYVTQSAPVSRAYQIFRKVFDATDTSLIGVQKNTEIANVYQLGQNYPNPFNPTTKIGYNLITKGFVTLKLYNVLGEEVRTLVNGVQSAGYQQNEFSAADLPSGVYFYTINVVDLSGSGKNFTDTKKMVVLK